jgi:hypothetical protein
MHAHRAQGPQLQRHACTVATGATTSAPRTHIGYRGHNFSATRAQWLQGPQLRRHAQDAHMLQCLWQVLPKHTLTCKSHVSTLGRVAQLAAQRITPLAYTPVATNTCITAHVTSPARCAAPCLLPPLRPWWTGRPAYSLTSMTCVSVGHGK